MMDNRIAAIKEILQRMGYGGKVQHSTQIMFCFANQFFMEVVVQ